MNHVSNYYLSDVNKEKLNQTFRRKKIYAYIFSFALTVFWCSVFLILIKQWNIASEATIKKEYILFFTPIIFYLVSLFYRNNINNIKKNFIIEIILINSLEFEITSFDGKQNSILYSKDFLLIKKWDHTSSYFFFKGPGVWIEGQNEIYQLIIDKRKFYIMPSCFEDKEGVYNFLEQISKFK